jgi:hypothetical protein
LRVNLEVFFVRLLDDTLEKTVDRGVSAEIGLHAADSISY